MRKLGKKAQSNFETFEAYACICSCVCSNCGCGYPAGAATSRAALAKSDKNYSRKSSMNM
mgnify:CR=1 FL=1